MSSVPAARRRHPGDPGDPRGRVSAGARARQQAARQLEAARRGQERLRGGGAGIVRGVGGVGTSVSDAGARPAWYGPSAAVPVPRISRSTFRPPALVTTVSQNSQMLQPGLPGSGLL